MDASYNKIDDITIPDAMREKSIGNDRVYAREISSGTLRGEQNIGDKNVKIDASNRRILIYDDNGDARILLGFDENGF